MRHPSDTWTKPKLGNPGIQEPMGGKRANRRTRLLYCSSSRRVVLCSADAEFPAGACCFSPRIETRIPQSCFDLGAA
ncbi:hypothetical protein BDQ94DRAFT_154799 [Aspergillus welwitschiae]|uniref:Uncharacterized protein n=1 Tax=Aspergillus welwitschiae TaxID=1341132 RepID=A0A3F3PJ47_9EURO|nr:hypothetical protein BDQ94DRAFT_154799 [Aspergillus welwitschiae]RDH26949.1 hypothetical protein BDQ94DRAFT_154799 [Aspergillus welwitschiae]